MNSLARRIRGLPRRRQNLTPARGVTPGPAVAAGHHVAVYPGIGASLSPLTALVASDGALIPAQGPGRHAEPYAAGRI